MIRIGFSTEEKQTEVIQYVREHSIRKVFVLYWRDFRTEYSVDCEIEYIEWADIIMYKFFYRLLEEIDDTCLIVVDELMRTQNRSELTYNCAHHYLNQTPHRIIYEWFPFIEDESDFMILLDYQDKGRYRGKGFSFDFLQEQDVIVKHHPVEFETQFVPITEAQRKAYEKKRDYLFDNLGMKDPDTIPRNLHVFVGSFKKPFIQSDLRYVARNKRFNLENVATYRTLDVELSSQVSLFSTDRPDYIVLDFPHWRLDFNDFLKLTKPRNVVFLSTGLPVDNYYQSEFESWLKRVGDFCAEASLRQQDRS